jgi:hypothetical protein
MEKIVSVQVLPDWRLDIRFSDGTSGMISIKDRLFGPMFEPLKDQAYFAQAKVDEFGAICWPNGADLAPDAIYEVLRSKTRVA